MFGEILRFELWYRWKRPATFIYFGILFLVGFAAMAWEDFTVGGGTGQVKDNAPTVIAFMMVILTAIPGFFLTSAIMGVPILRDYEHNTSSMFFTTPMKKFDYLMGRFLGSFLILVMVFLGLLMGLMLGAAMPWLDEERMLPYQAWHFVQPFLLLVIPNLFVTGAFFFMGGALTKRLLFVFVQGSALLVLYVVGTQLLRGLDNRELAGIIDPIGINLTRIFSRYWSPAQQNTMLFPLEGLILTNRLLWMAIGLGSLALTQWLFSFSMNASMRKKKLAASAKPKAATQAIVNLPSVQLAQGFRVHLTRVWALSKLYFVEVVRSVPFLAIVLFGMIMLILGASDLESMYGTKTYPSTYLMLQEIGGFTLFFVIIIIFYAGELVWRERDVRINQIYDALPMPDAIGLISKFVGLMLVHASLLAVLLLTGVAIQAVYGFFEFEIPVYLASLFGETLIQLALLSVLALFIQVMVNQKFVGHAVMVLFFILTLVISELGFEHSLFQFGSGSLGTFSDMNRFGHFVPKFSWYQVYWTGFTMILFALAVTFSVRGTDTLLKIRAQLAKRRLVRPLLITSIVAFLLFVTTGSYIYYNTVVLNEYRDSDEQEELQVSYEKTLVQFRDIPQPKIVETNLKVDIFPEKRDFHAEGYYYLKNKTQAAISRIHVQEAQRDGSLQTSQVEFSWPGAVQGTARVAEAWEEFGYRIYELDPPLQPSDSIRMDFVVDYVTKGFVEGQGNTDIVFNGTFFNNLYFPSFGYNDSYELGDEDLRRKKELPPKERMREREDSLGQHINLVGDDADHMRFEIILGTSADQIAVAPGYLQREWQENGRRYFHYLMDMPMFNFYSIVSANYELLSEEWVAPYGDTISLEVYYHQGHDYNIGRMMEAMKHSLRYYSEAFSPYQHRQMRILEFPRYASFAQSFANTVPFSEAIGFVLDIGEDDVDMAYYVTAHEMAHQWWGHQVSEAQVKGSAMLSETLSQYSALMVMKEKYPSEQMQEFLRYELDRYLFGRAGEAKKEQPLVLVESQGYIHYRKGSLAMYAFQDYIGEDSVNAALHRWVKDWAWRDDRYPTTKDLMGYFRAVTPDSFAYLITDLFETITLYENRTKSAKYRLLDGDRYEVDLLIEATKIRADSSGNEEVIPMNDWVDLGVYGKTGSDKDTLLYFQKVKFEAGESTHTVVVQGKPVRAGIDPLNKLIDRNPGDNVTVVSEE